MMLKTTAFLAEVCARRVLEVKDLTCQE